MNFRLERKEWNTDRNNDNRGRREKGDAFPVAVTFVNKVSTW